MRLSYLESLQKAACSQENKALKQNTAPAIPLAPTRKDREGTKRRLGQNKPHCTLYRPAVDTIEKDGRDDPGHKQTPAEAIPGPTGGPQRDPNQGIRQSLWSVYYVRPDRIRTLSLIGCPGKTQARVNVIIMI